MTAGVDPVHAWVMALMAASILAPFGPVMFGEDELEGASEADMTSVLAAMLWA